jgi:excinuclease ABC subunit C
VANSYNELLLRRRISESALDEIPGVSQSRKTELLKRFGSIRRLRKLSPDELAATPGINRNLALTILERLSKHN